MSGLRNILVPTDFSPCSDEALAQAFELAARFEAKVHILHVFSVPGLPDGASLSSQALDDIELAAKGKLEEIAKVRRGSGHVGQTLARMGEPSHTISMVAEQVAADLIVLGTHGRRGLSRFLMGSVAESVARTAPCSVLVSRSCAQSEAMSSTSPITTRSE